LRKVADLMRERVERLSALITLEMGKLIEESRGETMLSADILTYYADNAEKFLAPKKIEQEDGAAVVISQPIGVLLGIEPWNFPYYQIVRFVAPNLMIGNTVIVKHAGSVPMCANEFAELFLDAGAEPGVYTNLRLSNDQASRVIADFRIRGVAVTGSNRAGATVAAEAGKAMKRTTMELGGSDPYIVLEDANLEKAIEWAAWSRRLNCGQGCVDAKRFIVVEALYDKFLDGLRKAIADRVIGDPMEKATTLGPLSSEKAKSLLLDQIKRSVDAGATLVVGGTSIERPGSYVAPGILTNIGPDNPAYREEFCGPIFLLFKVMDEKAAITLANETEFGLASVIFTEDIERAQRLAKLIDTGMVFINHGAWTAPELPFGGVKMSGYGRELGELGMQEFVNKKLIRTQEATSKAL
jgi:succinate-semialdehyde dehydrogenase / glutarate-semialdehyde dehydrogenase